MTTPYSQFCSQLRTIGHPERLRILLAIHENGRTAQELQQITGLPANTLHNHLHKMRQLKIIEQTRFHRISQYTLVPGYIDNLLQLAQENTQAPTRESHP